MVLTFETDDFVLGNKIAAFDYDWTLVRPKEGRKFPKNVDDWEFAYAKVKDVLAELHSQGYSIVIFTNQTKEWKVEQIQKVIKAINVPMKAMIAMSKTEHKPSSAMWSALGLSEPDRQTSFFSGDALGREFDWSDTDATFAQRIGLSIREPEDVFGASETVAPPQSFPIDISEEQELVVMVGYPASGKSTIGSWLETKGYKLIQSDVFKTPARMIKVMKETAPLGKSIVIDATNASVAHRAQYLEATTSLGIKRSRCVWASAPMETCIERNKKREQKVPAIAFNIFRKKFEKPNMEEGFCEVIVIQ